MYHLNRRMNLKRKWMKLKHGFCWYDCVSTIYYSLLTDYHNKVVQQMRYIMLNVIWYIYIYDQIYIPKYIYILTCIQSKNNILLIWFDLPQTEEKINECIFVDVDEGNDDFEWTIWKTSKERVICIMTFVMFFLSWPYFVRVDMPS